MSDTRDLANRATCAVKIRIKIKKRIGSGRGYNAIEVRTNGEKRNNKLTHAKSVRGRNKKKISRRKRGCLRQLLSPAMC